MKPGYRTLEGILYAVAIISGAIVASGLWEQHWIVKVAGIIASTLGALGFGKQRTDLKIEDIKYKASEVASIRTELK